ncbi:hypothetical protein BD410DRAFT_446552 [Rickenella mellea]|uniref:F-box domain-containing protein n=1 Tax=Rickenella mellea TaxID=50990 RepID=A0A4Y7PVT0_9AGAM|nr:hypothetical protein BD410DRAFT_446552 [Rickenella mellea]
MPALRHFSGANIMPDQCLQNGALTSGYLGFSGNAPSISSWTDIFQAIHCLRNVETLIISSHNSGSMTRPSTNDLVPARFNHLKTLIVHNSGRQDSTNPIFESIFSMFRAPNLIKLTVEMKAYISVFNPSIEAIFDGDDPYPSLLELNVKCHVSHAFGDIFPKVLARLPNLQTLSIQGVYSTCRVDVGPLFARGHSFPPLRKLRLHYCADVSDSAIREMLAELRRGPRWPDFQVLELIGCSRMSLRYLGRLKETLGDKMNSSAVLS